MNLVKKLAITLTLTSTITLASCAYNNARDNLTATVATTSSTGITDVAFILPETSKENHYISIIGHFATGEDIAHHWKTTEVVGYKNHQDYRITYQVSEEDYMKVALVCGKNIYVSNMSSDQLNVVKEICSKYKAVEVVDLHVEDNYIHENIDESFRFNEEKYKEKQELVTE